ncbi:hypothetical protein SCHPADRAFT_735937 [Schizopora paradoxa]|uniref:Uncharacterized protein n=1 Tax=Schizopora paradoxa TaxID=27342 RepID=A0A0H2R0A6_9AGAM|nr:hypothetical protein SCHPADRAFT_735937 [Schizopora paradoxa]
MPSPTVLGTEPIPMLTELPSLKENVLPDVLIDTDVSTSTNNSRNCGDVYIYSSLHFFSFVRRRSVDSELVLILYFAASRGQTLAGKKKLSIPDPSCRTSAVCKQFTGPL